MSERWRRELRRLSSLTPSDELFRQAGQGSRGGPEPGRSRSGLVAVAAVVVVCTAAALLSWRAFGSHVTGPQSTTPPAGTTAPTPSLSPEVSEATGYFIQFPDRAEPASPASGGFRVRVVATTNLPDGTRVEISTTDEWSCCPQVEGGRIVVETDDSSCYGPVGDAANSTGFEATVTVRPDLDTLYFPGPVAPGGDSGSGVKNEQPQSVVHVLGPNFERLSGDQVVEQADGSRWLVAHARFDWPEPRCGGDEFPLFGGPDCSESDGPERQLQGDGLGGVMGEVMGAIGQARMCDFWGAFLPPEVQAAHPWPEFAAEWRAWLSTQDFSDAKPTSSWETGPLHWEEVSRQGDVHTLAVVHDGERIATLDVEPLPDFCPSCGSNVVPFWGVVGWTLE